MRMQLSVVVALACASIAGVSALGDVANSTEWLTASRNDVLNRYRRNLKDKQSGSCLFWNGAHLKSFDNRFANFENTCPHTLMKIDRETKLSVLYDLGMNCKGLQCSLALYITVDTVRYELKMTNKLSVKKNNNAIAVPYNNLDVKITVVGQMLVFEVKKYQVSLNGTSCLKGTTEGLCGMWDDNPKNDWDDPYAVTQDLPEFIKSHPAKSIRPCNSPVNIESPCKKVVQDAKDVAFCSNMQQVELAPCLNRFSKSDSFIAACEWDHCAFGEIGSCKTINNMIEACKSDNVLIPQTWRSKNVCATQCTDGYVHEECGPEMQAQCTNDLKAHIRSTSTCVEGCFCPAGLVEDGGKCVKRSACKCERDGVTYQPGTRVNIRCFTCVCRNGKFDCPVNSCPTIGGASGDPHYVSFDKKRFDFMGVHSYYLVKTNNLSIEAQHYRCNGVATCTQAVTVRYDHTVITMKQDHQFVLNGQALTRKHLPITVGNIRIKVASSAIDMVELLDIMVYVKWDGLYNVEVNVPDIFQEARGLLGNNDGDPKNDFTTRDGRLVADANTFGESWRVLDSTISGSASDDDEPIQPHVNPCDIDQAKKAKAEQLCGKIKNGPLNKCEELVKSQSYYENCMLDICASPDDKMEDFLCSALNGYAVECADKKVVINWRQSVQECAMKCSAGQTFQMCGNSCQRSCSDISRKEFCENICVEGCNCPPGLTLNANQECIPVASCPCFFEGKQYNASSIFMKIDTEERCTCGNGAWDCVEALGSDKRKYPRLPDAPTVCDATKHRVFTDCLPSNPKSCEDSSESYRLIRPAVCKTGCVCRDPYVLDPTTNECIEPATCPCIQDGKRFENGATTKFDCNDCTCVTGLWACTERGCPPPEVIPTVPANNGKKELQNVLTAIEGLQNKVAENEKTTLLVNNQASKLKNAIANINQLKNQADENTKISTELVSNTAAEKIINQKNVAVIEQLKRKIEVNKDKTNEIVNCQKLQFRTARNRGTFIELTGKIFYINEQEVNWSEARKQCQYMQMKQASFKSKNDLNQILENLDAFNDEVRYWVGASNENRQDGRMYWADGAKMTDDVLKGNNTAKTFNSCVYVQKKMNLMGSSTCKFQLKVMCQVPKELHPCF